MQEAILRKFPAHKEVKYRFSITEEEAQGIDGYIDEVPVSIKPDTCKAMIQLPESILMHFIFRMKQKYGLTLEYNFKNGT